MFALEFPFPDGKKQEAQAEILNLPSIEASALLQYYGFDLSEQTAERTVTQWLEQYPANWIFLAVLEALYQGRYKAISVEQILIYWKRRGQPICHFNLEFERLVCDRFPDHSLQEGQTQEVKETTLEESPNSLAGDELEPHPSEKSSLKHPDFYRKLKGFMGNPPKGKNSP